MAKPETAISIVDLTKKFGSQTIWADVSMEIPKGEITVILGPSGTGKSVLLKHLVGLLRPTSGHVYIDGQDIPTLNEKDLFEMRKKFGVLFQDGALFGSMNIQDNVAFPLREHSDLSEGSIRQIVTEKLELVGLQGAETKFPAEISGGMKKRAGLARALVLEPEILLFDEPDSGLDPVRTAYLNLLTLDLKRTLAPTIIIVTHHIETARTVPDYIGLIFARKLVMFGTRKEMFSSKKDVVTQFLHGSTEGPIGMSEEKDAAESTIPTGKTAELEKV
jgi:phospholipid/cholesterol/gamma-HCH transport system ATP-binding protein